MKIKKIKVLCIKIIIKIFNFEKIINTKGC